MSKDRPSYGYTQKARGLLWVSFILFAALLAVFFIATQNVVFVIIGVFLVVLVFSGIYAFLKGEAWSLSIEDNMLSWSYPRWPKSSGQIDLGLVRAVVVNDCSHYLEFTFCDGSSQKIKLIGYGVTLRDYLVAHHPQISLKFVEGT